MSGRHLGKRAWIPNATLTTAGLCVIGPTLLSAAESAPASSPVAAFWSALPGILWPTFAICALLVLRKSLRDFLLTVTWRMKSGAALKVASLEIGATYVTASGVSSGGLVRSSDAEGEARYQERRSYYEPNRMIFIVHKIAPSKDPKQAYDIQIYVIPHHNRGTLSGVTQVDYYFGKHWGNKVFTSTDRANGFPIGTSAYGSFVCTAKIHFSDGASIMAWRYIDFEMGGVPAMQPEAPSTKV